MVEYGFNDTKLLVNSYNEWDLLEEVIVGVVDGASVPEWDLVLEASMPYEQKGFYLKNAGKNFPEELILKAKKELEQFVSILKSEGVKVVRRPDCIDRTMPFATPNWQCKCGLYQAMPRDLLLIIGDHIIETPMAWRSRYHEIDAYRNLLKDYFNNGAKWVAAPKPLLLDQLYAHSYDENDKNVNNNQGSVNNLEPTFDAADFIRCGKDIFYQISNVTNSFGVEWLKRYLGESYNLHELSFYDAHPMHIDATFMPIAPGHVLVNPERVLAIPEMFKSWNIIVSPYPAMPDNHPLFMTSKWVATVNVLMLDEKRVMVEEQETELINVLKKNGFKPIACAFRHFMSFGGSFHCATLDVRRKGGLQSYF